MALYFDLIQNCFAVWGANKISRIRNVAGHLHLTHLNSYTSKMYTFISSYLAFLILDTPKSWEYNFLVLKTLVNSHLNWLPLPEHYVLLSYPVSGFSVVDIHTLCLCVCACDFWFLFHTQVDSDRVINNLPVLIYPDFICIPFRLSPPAAAFAAGTVAHTKLISLSVLWWPQSGNYSLNIQLTSTTSA